MTKEQVEALVACERTLYGSGGDVAKELPRLREDIDREMYQRLRPGYVRQSFENAALLIGIDLVGDPGECFGLRSRNGTNADRLLHVVESYPEPLRSCLSFVRPVEPDGASGFTPASRCSRHSASLLANAWATRRCAALVSVVRDADPAFSDLAQPEVLACPLVGVKQFAGSQLVVCPVEHLLLLKGGRGLPASGQRLAVTAKDLLPQASAFLGECVGTEMALARRKALLATLSERESFIQRGFDLQEAELAAARSKQSEKARAGNVGAQKELASIKEKQRLVTQRRHEAIGVLRREPDLIGAGKVEFIAHALVVPSSDPADREQFDTKTDEVAIALAWAFEESAGALVKDVHTPELARAAGLSDNPGFDLSSIRPAEKRGIEVKGRAGVGDVVVSANEWAKACNLREGYWL